MSSGLFAKQSLAESNNSEVQPKVLSHEKIVQLEKNVRIIPLHEKLSRPLCLGTSSELGFNFIA